jgi:hypothetical protein
MPNLFDANKSIATAHVRSEQLKGWFLAQAKFLFVLLSGTFLFLGVLLSVTNLDVNHLNPKVLLVSLPIIIPCGLLAIGIEGGTLFSAVLVKEGARHRRQKLDRLEKVRKNLSEEQYKRDKLAIEWMMALPVTMLITCVSFSVAGAELFWSNILAHSSNGFLHFIGYFLGFACSTLLIMFELNEQTVARIIERCIASSALIQIAMDQSAKSDIFNALFKARRAKLRSAAFVNTIGKTAEHGLYTVLVETLEMGGASVSAEQLKQDVKAEKEAADSAKAYLATGNEEVLQAPSKQTKRLPISIQRDNPKRKQVEKLVKQYGMSRVVKDIDQHVEESGMDQRTFRKHLEDIAANG